MWVKIEGFEEYLVNKEGQVFSTKSNIVLKKGIESWGYEMVNLRKNGKPNPHKVHKIVAQTFLGPRPDGFQINHKDGVKTNNHVSNLEYCTPKQNSQHAYMMGLSKAPRGEKHGNCKLSDKSVEEIRKLKGQITQQAAGDMFGVAREHIRDIWNGKRRKEDVR
jgi:hypothetical protein